MSKIKVEITASERITYKQIVEMDAEDYEKVKDLDGDDISEWVKIKGEHRLSHNPEYVAIEDYIDKHDVFDSDQEFTNVSVRVVSGK